jgi:hypothetical protein
MMGIIIQFAVLLWRKTGTKATVYLYAWALHNDITEMSRIDVGSDSVRTKLAQSTYNLSKDLDGKKQRFEVNIHSGRWAK